MVYGNFRFDAARMHRALPPRIFAFTVVADAWSVARRSYDASAPPDAFLEAAFPRGVQDQALRLAGVLKGDRAITRSECDRAVDNLDAFELITESVGAVATLLYGLYDLAAPTVAPPPADRAFPTSPAAKARVLDASWCHARIVAAARKLPIFF